MREDRGAGGRIQRVGRQRRRLVASTTCICRPASRTARWSSTIISRSNCDKQLYRDLPVPKDGWLTLPETPGLGFEPNRDAIREIAKLPLSQAAMPRGDG